MAKITDSTALHVLCSHPKYGAEESDFYHSGVYFVKEAIANLRRKGYHIQQRMTKGQNNSQSPAYFVDLEQVKANAIERRDLRRS